jgi:Putative MetA-pathway of phenol degradation
MRSLSRRAAAGALLVTVAVIGRPRPSSAADCPGRAQAIDTDRPDVTNAATVVPLGSLQVENGVNWAVRQTLQVLDASETRIRFGAAHCGEILVDVPNYARALNGPASSEFSEVVISVKRQLFVQSPSFTISVAAGVGVPSGGTGMADRGYNPYIQFPWSRSIAHDWSVNGMATVTWSTVAKTLFEPTLSLERELGLRCDVFVEYVGDYRSQEQSSQIIDVGGGWHVTPNQQLDFHIGAGLSSAAPHHYVGVGYSFRVDGLLAHTDGKK